MLLLKALCICICSLLIAGVSAKGRSSGTALRIKEEKRQDLLQNNVTWDENSLFINGERLLILSGEFHPYRLPVPGLWKDIFQKVKAIGLNAVSFYVDWALVEGKQGDFSAEGIFDFAPFFEAASEAGIYLIARPGPYINAESSGGGFPGWLQRITGKLRTPAPDYMNATEFYVDNGIGPIIAAAQITNGGPVILLQPENEYTQAAPGVLFPNPAYMQEVEDQFRQAGIVVPLISNDAAPDGHNAPGTGEGQVDIYGHDGYPLGFDCANPYTWPDNALPTTWHTLHEEQSPTTPYSIDEFQGGSFDPWGGLGFLKCSILLNNEFERVFYKNDFSFGVKIFNIYMIYGGTNWGNLGHPGGYTSYDYGSSISEDRTVTREKYSELKLEVNFLKVSPAYLIADVHNYTNTSFTSTPSITVTQLSTNTTSFWIIRHSNYSDLSSTDYNLNLPTSSGTISIPQSGGSLGLNGRDSKIFVTDYSVGSYNLLYSTAEIFTWKAYSSETILVVYGGANETNELAIHTSSQPQVIEGNGVTINLTNGLAILHWQTGPDRSVVQIDSLVVYILDRNSAYNYWVLDLPASNRTGNYSTADPSSVIVKAGYLLRTAQIEGSTLALTGDLNATVPVEVIGAPSTITSITFNGKSVSCETSSNGIVSGTLEYDCAAVALPVLSSLNWKVGDSLPEIGSAYDDSEWPSASNPTTNNPARNLTTPTSLYSSDYGFNTGSFVYRGHFTANGQETTLSVHTQGGTAYGASVWLNSTFLGSWPGIDATSNYTQNLTVSALSSGQPYVITVLVDDMGYDENGAAGSDEMKNPRGILDYSLNGHSKSDITWKITGNLGGENYVDRTRGPLNEGGMYGERQGWHLPNPPTQNFPASSPLTGIQKAGVVFYTASFELDLPVGYDIPLSFVFTNTSAVPNYRSQLYVNGYQFGKYVSNIGPQTAYPVPEGILNYHGTNYVALSLWALDSGGAKLGGLQLNSTAVVQSGYGTVELSPMPAWNASQRAGAY